MRSRERRRAVAVALGAPRGRRRGSSGSLGGIERVAMSHVFTAFLPMLALFTLSGCSHPRHTYTSTDEFFKGGHFSVPSEFRRGTASRADVDAWSCSLLGTNPLESLRVDIDGDRIGELFISQPAHRGTGGNSHLVFRERSSGFQYLGTLGFGLIRPLTPDIKSRARVLTSWWIGGGECMVTMYVLTVDGFRAVTERALPCGDSATDGEGGRLHKQLFDSETLTLEFVRSVLGSEL